MPQSTDSSIKPMDSKVIHTLFSYPPVLIESFKEPRIKPFTTLMKEQELPTPSNNGPSKRSRPTKDS